tara:strand:- start:14638 stop:15717 length:1080 start_codon:yes stop_codon:yes gene_type:complete
MTTEVNASIINAQFVEDIQTPGEREKTAAEIGAFLQDKMRERSFADNVIPVKPVSRQDLQISENHDTPVYIDFLQPNSEAMAISFRGRPDVNYVTGARYSIPFFTVSSLEYEKAVQELLVYPYPVMKVIEDQVVRDMEGIKDFYFMTYVEAAAQRSATLTTGQYTAGRIIRGEEAVAAYAAAGAYDNAVGRVQRNDLIQLGKIFSNSRRPKGCLLWSSPDWDDVAAWTIEDFGDGQERVTFKGLGKGNIGVGSDSVKCIISIKVDLVIPGNVYLFAPPEYLGRNLLLNGTQFWAEKKRNMIRFMGWMDCGMGIGNVASVAKLELYNRAASLTLPAESTVGGGVFNEAATGFTYPQVEQF